MSKRARPRDGQPVSGPVGTAGPARTPESSELLEIFLVTPPGLEKALAAEAERRGFRQIAPAVGGVAFAGDWPDIWRANLELRGASRVLVRVASFRAPHLAPLDKRARQVPWKTWLREGQAVKVEATCRASRIYHAGAAAQRVEGAIRAALGPAGDGDPVRVLVRIEDDLCTISLDSSGELLHRRGQKGAVARAPLRETLAALFLGECGFDGREPVLDPMCGSGTFVIEAAGIAAGLQPGRSRRFAFERFATFEPVTFEALHRVPSLPSLPFRFIGCDRDAGAVAASRANAELAGLGPLTDFRRQPVSALERPEGQPGLVIVNPPYGTRIGEKGPLRALHARLGAVLRERFAGWRVGIVTTEAGLARATGLPFREPGPPVDHGGLRVRLWQTGPLP
jgi:putative N6-adenine-specific DNA methylase